MSASTMNETVNGDAVGALLFDLGNVVMRIDWQGAFAHWAAAAGIAANDVAARFRTDHMYARHERGEIEAATFFAHLDQALSLGVPAADVEAGWNAIFAGLMPGIERALARVHGQLPLYVFSNTNAAHEATWRHLHADTMALFADIFLSHRIGLRKPEAAAYQHVAARIGLPPARILFFDDLAENVDAARAVGMQSVLVQDAGDVSYGIDAVLAARARHAGHGRRA